MYTYCPPEEPQRNFVKLDSKSWMFPNTLNPQNASMDVSRPFIQRFTEDYLESEEIKITKHKWKKMELEKLT